MLYTLYERLGSRGGSGFSANCAEFAELFAEGAAHADGGVDVRLVLLVGLDCWTATLQAGPAVLAFIGIDDSRFVKSVLDV